MRALVVLLLPVFCLAAVRNYNITMSLVTMAPDGYARTVRAMNGLVPGPVLEVETGDTLVVQVRRQQQQQQQVALLVVQVLVVVERWREQETTIVWRDSKRI